MSEKRATRVKRAVDAEKMIVIVRTTSSETALAAAEAVALSGVRLIDIPVTVPGVMQVIRELAGREELVIGVGSVTEMHEAADAIDAGASFIVCPHTDRMIIDYCRDNGIFVAAGAMTPTEVMVAHLAGVDLAAVYPIGLLGGAEYTRALLRPMPFLNLMPVGGVSSAEALQHLKAGACAVGVTDAIIDPQALAQKDFGRVRERARAFREVIAAKGA